jgi:dihydrofolate reductase
MGRLIYSMSVSLDGFVNTAEGSIDWVHVDEELHGFFNDQAREVSAFVYGRRMYELMAGYWPTADDEPDAVPVEIDFARIWRDKPKIVVSRSLETVAWNSRLIRGDAVAELARLRAEVGSDLGVGGPTTAAPLIRAGLIDEYHLFVNPVILGGGTPFFPTMADRQGLELVETRAFGGGVIYLRYRPAA